MLIGVNQVMKILNVSKSKAYESIKILNTELKKDGYLTINGRIPVDYLIKRYNLNQNDMEIVKK